MWTLRVFMLTLVTATFVACTPNPKDLAARCGAGSGASCAEAKATLERLCRLNHADACLSLAEVYATGRGGPKDPAKAKEFFVAACERGLAAGCRAAQGAFVGQATPGAALWPDAGAASSAAGKQPLGAVSGSASPPGSASPSGSASAALATPAAVPPKPAPRPVTRAPAGPSRAVLQARCERNDEAACMALGREMIKDEVRRNPAAARQLLEQVRAACADGDEDACELVRRGLSGR